jgi:hypothetical protein
MICALSEMLYVVEIVTHHLHRDPPIRPKFLRYELRRQLCREEADIEDSLPGVVVVRVDLEIL